jgi:hypothetical protein
VCGAALADELDQLGTAPDFSEMAEEVAEWLSGADITLFFAGTTYAASGRALWKAGRESRRSGLARTC